VIEHLSQLKASAFFSLHKIGIKNAATYTWDWYRHLAGDGALFLTLISLVSFTSSLQPSSQKGISKVNDGITSGTIFSGTISAERYNH
jgi:hypothetical protein